MVAAGCSKKLEGPQPAVDGVSPGAVCQAQLTTSVTVAGSGLSPLLEGHLKEAQLELPRVSLSRVQDVAGGRASGTREIPDDSGSPDASRIRWTNQQTLSFDVFPELDLEPGLYDVTVANANGKTATLPGSLLAVPPPTLTTVEPDLLCGDKQNVWVLTGDFFIQSPDAQPTLYVNEQTFAPATMEGCRELPGSAGLRACTRITVDLGVDALAPGNYAVRVENPAPVGCGSTETVDLTIVPEPTLARVVPELGCSAQGERMIRFEGTGFLTVAGAAPSVTLTNGATTVTLPTTAADCTPVTGPAATVASCTTLSATLGQNALPAAPYQVTITNPAPADCGSTQAVTYTVVAEPVVTTVAPDAVCTAEGEVQLTVTGENFLRIDGVEPTVAVGSLMPAATTSNCTALQGPTGDVQSCTTLTLSLPETAVAGAHDVRVTNPEPAGCTSAMGPLVTVFGRPEISAVAPAAICSQAGSETLVLTGTGFTTVDATPPTVTVTDGTTSVTLTPTASDCTAVSGTTQTVALCTTLTVALPATPPVGTYTVSVTNPGPIGCSSSGTTSFEVTAPPTIADVQPATICSSGDTLTLTGTGFVTGSMATVKLLDDAGQTVVTASMVTVTSTTSATAVFPSGIPTNTSGGSPYTVRFDAGGGCSATWGAPQNAGITVTQGPQVFFVDPNVVYNGINTVATVYGTGFTGTVQSVTLTEQASGAATVLTITGAPRPNQVQVLVPESLNPGVYDLTLQDNTNCVATLNAAIEVVSQTTFALAGIQPPFALQGESTSVNVLADSASATSTFQPLPRVYLNPSNATGTVTATALGAVSIVDPKTLSALVPGTLSAGKYDLIVVNPDKTVGFLAGAFEVTTLAPPDITTVSPGSVINTGATFSIFGTDFRTGATASLSCFDQAGAAVPAPTLTSTLVSATEMTATVGATSAAACIVRVTNTDNATYDDFSALVFTNSAKNLYAAQAGPTLTTARRAPVTLGADATDSARFLHVISGDDGAGAAFDTVESSALTLLGEPTGFRTQKTRLNQARTLAAGVAFGPWLYVAGGSNGGTQLSSVERAYVLNPEDRPEITNLFVDVNEGSGLAGGLWYYRVSAVMGASDAFNPNGENLASDPFPIQLPALTGASFHVTLSWNSIPGAATYRVYRSPAAGSAAGSEQVIAEVTTTTYQDQGAAPISADTPLPVGAVGNWQSIASLNTAREGAAMTWGFDPADPNTRYLYVLGGRSSATSALNSYEYLAVTLDPTNGNQTVGSAWSLVTTNTIGNARWQLSASHASSQLSPVFPAGESWLYVGSGYDAAGTTLVKDIRAARVTEGGALTAFQNVVNAGLSHAGYAMVVAADLVIAVGGFNGTVNDTIGSGAICGSSGTNCQAGTSAPSVANFNTGQNMLAERYLIGGTLHGAYIYVTGGVTTGNAVSNTTEYRIW